jgi:ribulose kinase
MLKMEKKWQVQFLTIRAGKNRCTAMHPKTRFRQHPKDYLEGLEYTIVEALKQAPAGVAENVVGISVDTTGSTPVAVDEKGVPLSLTPGFRKIRMPCLYCGKTILRLRKLKK